MSSDGRDRLPPSLAAPPDSTSLHGNGRPNPKQGAAFEIVELNVTAGEDVAFAYALLRCGRPTELETDPSNRLRLSIGLRKEGNRWIVTHEHHSFPSP
jgi:ketosteroid isomerase-like protein